MTFFESDDANEAAAREFENAQNGLDKNGKPFDTFEGPNGTVVDHDGNELPKDRYGEYIRR